MWVEFDSLPDNSRIWIYQANRPLTASEQADLSSTVRAFCDQWSTHGQPMRCSFKIRHSQFLILVADEDFQQPSGCSIDNSVRVLKTWQNSVDVDWFDRTRVVLLRETTPETWSLVEAKNEMAEGKIRPDHITFNNLVRSKGELTTDWETTVGNSWLKRFLPDPEVS